MEDQTPNTRFIQIPMAELNVQQLREQIRDLPSSTTVIIKHPAEEVIAFEFTWKGRTLEQIAKTWPDQTVQDLVDRLVSEILEHEFSEEKETAELLVTIDATTMLQLMSELIVRRIAAT